MREKRPRAHEQKLLNRESASLPVAEASLDGEGRLTVRFAVWESTGGPSLCEAPVARLESVTLDGARLSARLQWRQRGCSNDQMSVFTIRLEERVTAPIEFSWAEGAESQCATATISPTAEVTPLAPRPCPE